MAFRGRCYDCSYSPPYIINEYGHGYVDLNNHPEICRFCSPVTRDKFKQKTEDEYIKAYGNEYTCKKEVE